MKRELITLKLPHTGPMLNGEVMYSFKNRGAVLRWWRNRMGRPLSPSQIHQKNISMLSKFRTSGTQKSRSLSSKTGRKKYKRQKKETKEVGRELHPRKGVLKREEFPNTRKHSPCRVCGEPSKNRGQRNRKEE